MAVVLPVSGVLLVAAPALVAGEVPEAAYVFSDPLTLPALSLTFAVMIVSGALFPAPGPKAEPAAPPRSRRLAPRLVAAVALVMACLGLRVVVIRDAAPTRQAIDLMRRHAVAGPRIGTPVEVGWDVGGWIHASGEMNDERVPPRIDASVPVRGPRGAGVLVIEGREEGSRWAWSRVVLRMERGERIEIVKGAPPPPGWELDPTIFALIGGVAALAGLSSVGIVLMLRGSDPSRAIASMEARPGLPFTLRFTPAAPGAFNVWLRFELDWQGGEDDYGVTAQIEARAGGGHPAGIELRIGDTAPPIGPKGVRNSTLYRIGYQSSGDDNSIRATAQLIDVKAASAGAEVVVSGVIAVAPRCSTRGLLVFVVPS